jgi:hypothetical protein
VVSAADAIEQCERYRPNVVFVSDGASDTIAQPCPRLSIPWGEAEKKS